MKAWLDRGLSYGPHFVLCLNAKAFQQALADIDLPREEWEPWINEGEYALTHTYNHHTGEIACIVCLAKKPKDVVDLAAIVAHEATHVWQRFCQHIGESKPGMETEAYAIQYIVWQLMDSYRRQTKGRWK